MTVAETLKLFIVEDLLEEPDAEIDLDDSLIDRGLLDSLALFQLALFIEEQFEVKVEDDEIVYDNFETIRRLADLVEAKLQ